MVRDIVRLDWKGLNLRSALTGTVVLALVLVFIGALGPVTIAAGLAAVFVIAGGPARTKRPDALSWAFVAGGAVVTLVVSLSAGIPALAASVLTVITLVATLMTLWGKRAGTLGVFALLWAVIALLAGASSATALSWAAAFAVGGVLAIVAMWLVSLRTETALPSEVGESPDQPDQRAKSSPAGGDARTAIVWFSIVRAIAVGVSVWLGYLWFPDHPIWAALTLVLVVRPPAHQTVAVALGRGLGTALGVVVSVLIVDVASGDTLTLVIAFVAAAYLMLATSKVNAALSTAFTTVLLLVSQPLAGGDAVSTGLQRLWATLMGILIAFVIIVLLRSVSTRLHPSHTAEHGSEPGEEPTSPAGR